MNKDNKTELKDKDLEKANGGAVNDGEFIQGLPFASLKTELVIPGTLKIADKPAFSAVDPVTLKTDCEKTEEKNSFIPIPY